MQSLVEAKIRHAIATGPLPHIVRGSATEAHTKQDANKGETSGSEQSK
jgi:hypothetical protein